MKQRPMFEQIPELLRPQNCAGHITADNGRPTSTVTERACPTPAEWFATATGTPVCEAHMLILTNVQRQKDTTPP